MSIDFQGHKVEKIIQWTKPIQITFNVLWDPIIFPFGIQGKSLLYLPALHYCIVRKKSGDKNLRYFNSKGRDEKCAFDVIKLSFWIGNNKDWWWVWWQPETRRRIGRIFINFDVTPDIISPCFVADTIIHSILLTPSTISNPILYNLHIWNSQFPSLSYYSPLYYCVTSVSLYYFFAYNFGLAIWL